MRRRKELVLVGKRAWLFVGACLLAAVVLAGMLGCTASPPGIDPGDDSGQDPERPIGGGTARVTGRVVDAEDPSRPIEGAFVYIPVSTSNAQRAASLRSSNYAQAYSASDGSYALEEIPDGQRTIVVEPPANSEWAPVSVTVELEPGASITIIFTLVTVELNDRIATVTVDPPDTTIATGAAQQYAATVISTSGAAITITPIWLTTGGMGTITPQGVFQAGSIEGKGTIVAVAGRHAGTTPVTVSGSGNQLPQLSLRVTPTQGAAPLGVTATATASDPDGAILSAYLDWGDGSAPFEAATYPGGLSHTYLQANTYSVTARVRDDGGAQVSSTQQVTVEPAPGGAPEVSLSATPTSGAAPLSVSFQGAGSDPDGEIVGWDLDYGDGGAHWTGAAAPAGVTHTYETGGTYQAVLTGVDGSGSSGAAAVTIEVSTPSNLPPQAELTVSPGSGEAPLTVSFTGSGSDSDGTVVEYRLDFQGDGVDDWSQSSSPDGVTYIYGAAGTYQPTFTVVDDDGATGGSSATVTVEQPGVLEVSPTSLSFPLLQDAKTLEVTSTLPGSLSWSVTDAPSWCMVTPLTGSGSAALAVTVQRWDGLPAGWHDGTITVDSNHGQVVVAASIEVPEYVLNPRDGSMRLLLIPAGEAIFGSLDDDPDAVDIEKPQFRASLPAYYLGQTEVTNAQYKLFVDATGHRNPDHWVGGVIPTGIENHPVVYVSWEDAKAYCDWATLRLPSELEWEKGARGTAGLAYPWGDVFDKSLCRHGSVPTKLGTAHVGSYPLGASPYGLLDMAGNVWEFCADWYDNDVYIRYSQGDLSPPAWGQERVLRGGSWFVSSLSCRSAGRQGHVAPTFKYHHEGFRVARDYTGA
jgi:formylglycine-generating enzyme required for sulfatase activity